MSSKVFAFLMSERFNKFSTNFFQLLSMLCTIANTYSNFAFYTACSSPIVAAAARLLYEEESDAFPRELTDETLTDVLPSWYTNWIIFGCTLGSALCICDVLGTALQVWESMDQEASAAMSPEQRAKVEGFAAKIKAYRPVFLENLLSIKKQYMQVQCSVEPMLMMALRPLIQVSGISNVDGALQILSSRNQAAASGGAGTIITGMQQSLNENIKSIKKLQKTIVKDKNYKKGFQDACEQYGDAKGLVVLSLVAGDDMEPMIKAVMQDEADGALAEKKKDLEEYVKQVPQVWEIWQKYQTGGLEGAAAGMQSAGAAALTDAQAQAEAQVTAVTPLTTPHA